ncbi:MAG: DUF502 domain-containing protein [Phycisphaerae bacterium]|jgi:uncharacterized membrane protein
MSLTSGFKSYFLRGLAVLLPTILTIWIFIWGFTFIQSNISVHINRALVWLTMKAKGLDWNNDAARQIWEGFWVSGWGSIAGFIIALFAVCIIGMILASVVGRGLWKYIEKLIMNAPFLRRVYPYIKQITDFLLVQNKAEKLFLRVVGVEYPRKGIWSIGLVTGEGLPRLVGNFRKTFLTILIPTSPTPFTGFVIMVPEKETIDLDITVEEAMRFTISAGVITPSTKLETIKEFGTVQPQEEPEAEKDN